MTQPFVSVIIPTYNRQQKAMSCLRAVSTQTAKEAIAQVIVVDDGSDQPFVCDPAILAPPIRVLRQRNAGPAAARNRALEHCTGTLCWILNDDAVPAPECLERLLAFRAQTPRCRAVIGSFDFALETLATPFMRMATTGTMAFAFDAMRQDRAHDWQCFWTCNILVDTDAIERVGRFDGEIFGIYWGGEDVELGYRLQCELGIRTYFCREARCWHDHVITLPEYLRRRHWIGRNLFQMYRKHRDARIIYMPAGLQYGEHSQRVIGKRIDTRRALVDRTLAAIAHLLDAGLIPRNRESEAFPLLRKLTELCGQEILWRGVHDEAASVLGLAPDTGEPDPARLFDIRPLVDGLWANLSSVLAGHPRRVAFPSLGVPPLATAVGGPRNAAAQVAWGRSVPAR
jgi:GT2 family glycosyltransferase